MPTSGLWYRQTEKKQDGSLPQTDRASPFVSHKNLPGQGAWSTLCVKFFFLSILITMQNLFVSRVRACRWSQKIGDAGVCPCAWLRRCWPLETRPSPTCYRAKFGRSRSNGTSVRSEIRRIMGPSCPAFLGHSRSLAPTQIVGCLWLSLSDP